MLDAVTAEDRRDVEQVRGCVGPRHLPSPPRAALRLEVFLKNPLEFQMVEQSGLPCAPRPHRSITGNRQDARLAQDLFADDEGETNSFPWTHETFPGEVQLLPEKSGKAKAGNSAALIFNNSLA